MHKVVPTKHQDGTETVKLYGTTVDVTGKSKFTLFKKDYKVYRPRVKKAKKTEPPKETEQDE
jgi:hypothetical protein